MSDPYLSTQAGSWLRLLANWGLSLSGSACLLPVEEEGRCPMRPLLAVIRRPLPLRNRRDSHDCR